MLSWYGGYVDYDWTGRRPRDLKISVKLICVEEPIGSRVVPNMC